MYKSVDGVLIESLCLEASKSSRQRAHYNFHQSPQDPVQRLLIALQTETYVPVHKHSQVWKWEMLILLRGAVDCLIYDDKGIITNRFSLADSSSGPGIEIAANTWHSIVCMQPDSVILELKPGPYEVENAAVFASWAPGEGDSQASQFLQWQRNSNVGQSF